jgi:hypothetical protein
MPVLRLSAEQFALADQGCVPAVAVGAVVGDDIGDDQSPAVNVTVTSAGFDDTGATPSLQTPTT